MSKSKGNTVDPLGLIDRFGADALRFTMAAMESQGRDIKLDEKRVEGYRNFATKLWNAARFLQGNGVGASTSVAAPSASLPVNRWIIGEVVETLAKMDKALADLRFDEVADAIYHFTWGTFCDWYVELVKGGFDDETRAVAAWAFDQILVMLHPLMPFITEELWHAMGARERELVISDWSKPEANIDTTAKGEIERLIRIIGNLRADRTALDIPAGAILPATLSQSSEAFAPFVARHAAALRRMARIDNANVDPTSGWASSGPRPDSFVNSDMLSLVGHHTIRLQADELTFVVAVQGYDADAQRARLSKAIAAAEKDRDSLAARLATPAFAERAKPEAVEKARADHDARAAEAVRLGAALARLG